MTDELYDGYRDWKGWASEGFGKVDRACFIYFARELARCRYSSLAGLRVLELGFGNGAFAAWAKLQGAHYVGIEVLPDLVKAARQAGFDAFLFDQLPADAVASGSVDLIVAFDVFEHLSIDALTQVLRQFRECLRAGGQLIGRVPSGDSPFARAIQHGDLTHRSAIGSSALRQIAARSGFEVVSVRSPVLPLSGLGFGVLLRRTMVSVFRSVAYPFIATVLMGGGNPVLTPNMLFVLKKQ